eukprot:362082-Chlamydomonas_euryale.AAC.6
MAAVPPVDCRQYGCGGSCCVSAAEHAAQLFVDGTRDRTGLAIAAAASTAGPQLRLRCSCCPRPGGEGTGRRSGISSE